MKVARINFFVSRTLSVALVQLDSEERSALMVSCKRW